MSPLFKLYMILLFFFSILGDREWIPDHSINAHVDNAVAVGVLKSTQHPSSSGAQQKTGKIGCKVPYWWLTLFITLSLSSILGT